MRRILLFGLFLIGPACLAAPPTYSIAPVQNSKWPAVAPRVKAMAAQIVAKYAKTPPDNLAGGIAWGTSYEMDAFLEMYRATGDTSFLDDFVVLANGVLAARADVRGERDWEGKSPKGWLTGGHYTIGMPYTVLDKAGKPALEIQTMARAGNDATKIEISPSSDGKSFALTYTNDFRKDPPLRQTYDALTPQNVEARLNGEPGKEALLRVKRLGNHIPRAYPAFTPPVGLVALHGHHTGRIASPLAQFAALVKRAPKLVHYSARALKYLHCAEEAMAEIEPIWHDEGDYGYTNFQKGIPFWSDGVPEPLNVQAVSGSAYLNLYDATGKALYLDRATKLARLIRRNFEAQPDGTFLYRYWFGIVRTGWKAEDNVSVNTPAYPGQMNIEDLSHFQLSMRFIVECYQRGLVFTRADLDIWARTFHAKMYRPAPDGGVGTLADNVAGARNKAAGTYDYAVAGLAQLDMVDPALADTLRTIYEKQFNPFPERPVALYGWAVLARVEAERNRATAPTHKIGQ